MAEIRPMRGDGYEAAVASKREKEEEKRDGTEREEERGR